MKTPVCKISINGINYFYSRTTDTLYYDRGATKQCPVTIFGLTDYQSLLRQLQTRK